MKKRMLMLLIVSVSFAPAVLFADEGVTRLGESKWNEVTPAARHCEGQKSLPAKDSRDDSGSDTSSGRARAARAS